MIELNMKSNFLEKSYTQCDGKNWSRTLFWKSKIERIFGFTVRNFVCLMILFVFIVNLSWWLPRYIATTVMTIYFYHPINWIFYCLIAFTPWGIWHYVYCSYLFPSWWCLKFIFILNFILSAVFLHDRKCQYKSLIIL